MAIDLANLAPYKSFIVAEVKPGAPKALVSRVIEDLEGLLGFSSGGNRTRQKRVSSKKAGELEVGFIHYVEEKPPAWSKNTNLKDRQNHVVLVCRRNRHVVVCLSDPGLRDAIFRSLGDAVTKGLAKLARVKPGFLNAAFAKGRAKTLWLSGTHRSTSMKADSKVLSGIELENTLDPLTDQTYFFTALRCETPLSSGKTIVGVSPRGSRIWTGISKDWSDFQDSITTLLKHLDAVKTEDNSPLPILALPSTNITNAKVPFDAALLSPELFAEESTADPETWQQLERFAYDSYFDIHPVGGLDFDSSVHVGGKLLGTVEVRFDVSDPEQIKWKVNGAAVSNDLVEEHKRFLNLCSHERSLKVWFESGHTITDGALFQQRFRDIPFKDYQWVNFSGYDVGKEKPTDTKNPKKFDPSKVGKDDSLFSWVKNAWPPGKVGWLACDDGANEKADFVHLDDTKTDPVLTLVHVKAAGHAGNREISVSKYEVVTGQAVKNLRHLDSLLLEEGLAAGVNHKISDLVWLNGNPSTRNAMIAALKKLKRTPLRQVVVIQPHNVKARWLHARSNSKSSEAGRLKQLDTLLLSAKSSCNGLSAKFIVIGAA